MPPTLHESEKDQGRVVPIPLSADDHEPEIARAVFPIFPTLMVLVLAFLLGSTPARNSDFWLHLATGKALMDGKCRFGEEPFTISAPDKYWTNPSWLYDTLVYLIYHALGPLGGPALVITKAMLVAALALFMILSARTSQRVLAASAAVALALVAMGPWLSLKPICVSFLLLAWTTWYLEWRVMARNDLSIVSFWPMFVVFAFWANMDRWFILGPVLVGIYGLGSMLSRKSSLNGGRVGSIPWAIVLLAGLVTCTLNPHHFHVFTVPFEFEISGAFAPFQQDPFLRSTIIAPFRDHYYGAAIFHRNPASLAFWTLAILTLASLFANFARWPARWPLTWLLFFVAAQVKTEIVPFLAIVSVPIVARNFDIWLARRGASRSGQATPVLTTLLLPRIIGMLVLTAVVVSAWPGWLQVGTYGPRGWRANVDSSMQSLGERIAGWQRRGKMPEGECFNYSLEAANYLAWLCPDLKCFANSHLHFSEESAAAFVAVREGLSGVKLPGTQIRDWRAILRNHQIGLLVVHDMRPTLPVLGNLFSAFRECPLLLHKGRGALFGWRDPVRRAAPDRYADLEVSFLREAFQFRNAPILTSPARDAIPPVWWDAFWRPRSMSSVERDEATALLVFFDSSLAFQGRKNLFQAKCRHVAGLVLETWNLGAANVKPCVHLAIEPIMTSAFLSGLDDGPMEVLYLAVRAARRALQADPDDADACFLLGEAYYRLGERTRERAWGPVLGHVRTCEMMAAFHKAVKLRPQLWQAHERMAQVFLSMEFKDLALQHLQESQRYRAGELASGESQGAVTDHLARLQQSIGLLARDVEKARDRFDANAANLRVTDRADMAARFGLVGHALGILLKSDISAFLGRGLEMELKLLLKTGDVEKVRDWLDRTHKDLLGSTDFHWIKAQMEAGLGDYEAAEASLQKMGASWGGGRVSIPPNRMLAEAIGDKLLSKAAYAPFPLAAFDQVPTNARNLPRRILYPIELMNRQAKSEVLQGVFALEAGQNKKAFALCTQCSAFWDSSAGAYFTDQQTSSGKQLAQYFLERLGNAQP